MLDSELSVTPMSAFFESKFEVVLGGDLNLILLMVECIHTANHRYT